MGESCSGCPGDGFTVKPLEVPIGFNGFFKKKTWSLDRVCWEHLRGYERKNGELDLIIFHCIYA